MALCGTAGIWTAFWVVAGRCGQTPNGAAGVRTHIENNVFEFERHGAALRIRCATPFKRVSAYGTEREREREREREAACASRAYNIYYGITVWTILPFKKCNGTAGIFKL